MARKKAPACSNPNAEIAVAVATWKIMTGRPQYELAEMLGIRPCNLSRIMPSSGNTGGRHSLRIVMKALWQPSKEVHRYNEASKI